MKCQKCNSEMFVVDETTNSRSHVTFYRCSLCVSEHVSSQAIMEAVSNVTKNHFLLLPAEQKRYLMV